MPEWAVAIVVAIIAAGGTYLGMRHRVRSKEKIGVAQAAIDGFTELVGGLQSQLDDERVHCRKEIDWLRERIGKLEGRQQRIEKQVNGEDS